MVLHNETFLHPSTVFYCHETFMFLACEFYVILCLMLHGLHICMPCNIGKP